MIKVLFNLLLKNKQLIKYCIIGCCCAGIDFIIYWLLVHIASFPYILANIISVHSGIFASFCLNRHFTFKMKNKILFRFISFYSIGIIGLMISSVMLIILIEKIELNELVSKAFTVTIVALIQFILNKYISFRNGK